MVIGTDGSVKSGINRVIDLINFTFGIKPETIPLGSKYGIRINSAKGVISETIKSSINSVISNLNIPGLSISNISIDEQTRKVTVNLLYKDTIITKITEYNIGS